MNQKGNTKLLILGLVLAALVLSFSLGYIYVKEGSRITEIFGIKLVKECTEEGELIGVNSESSFLPCCEGLKSVSCAKPDKNGSCPPGCVGAVICSDCGDGRCGAGENKCNCPDDCNK